MEKKYKDATGLYYLIRNGPIIEAIASQQRRLNVVVDEKYNDGSKGPEEEETKEKEKRKRKSSSPKSYPLRSRSRHRN
eukprot:CAMPEP_0170908212 /NCGR_PEP_ID=MMETSP0735-20130129/1778_1 /TAXON_ID=186038 /ORGANISM="Fragilariopsis kerguelensis, Strain L26-C5" /LENGTH=77 /DNA_ID=CAMNT_0011304507 /DNA_START=81 /DNA_END=315 /DNA_ORIENTATION=-